MVVKDDMNIALADDIVASTAGHALRSAGSESELYAMTLNIDTNFS